MEIETNNQNSRIIFKLTHNCGRSIKSLSTSGTSKLIVNSLKKRGMKNLDCHVCNSSFNSKYLLKRHLSIAHKICYYSCSICKQTFNKYSHFKIHTSKISSCQTSKVIDQTQGVQIIDETLRVSHSMLQEFTQNEIFIYDKQLILKKCRGMFSFASHLNIL